MPIYEYKCGQCAALVEKLIRNQADIPTVCPSCGAKDMQKQFSVFSAASSKSASSCGGGACDMAGPCPGSMGGGCPGSCGF